MPNSNQMTMIPTMLHPIKIVKIFKAAQTTSFAMLEGLPWLKAESQNTIKIKDCQLVLQ